MTYDEYDELCEKVSAVKTAGDEWIPSKEDLSTLEKISDITFCLVPIIRIIENGIKDTDPEIVKTLNKMVIEKVEFTEEEIKNKSKKIHINYEDFDAINEMAERAKIDTAPWISSLDYILECIEENPKPWLFLIILLLSDKSINENNHGRKLLKRVLEKYFEPDAGDKPVIITKEEYERIKKQARTTRIKRGRWWPTEEEIRLILEPNIKNTYDFIIWLLEMGREPDKEEDIRSKKMLEKVLSQNVSISRFPINLESISEKE